MGRRSTKEKKRRRLLRQAAAGDATALERAVERAPHAAFATCEAALAKNDANALPAARRLASQLRREGRAIDVARLAQANGGRDRALALEAALALFSNGDDSGARDVSHGHPEIEQLLEPLRLASHEPVTSGAATVRAPLTEKHAAAFAAAEALAASNAGATTPERAEACIAALLGFAPASSRDSAVQAIAGEIPLQPPAERGHLARALGDACAPHTLGTETEIALARLLAFVTSDRADPLAYAPEDVGSALLARGFARLDDDPAGARDDFERAAREGAALTEALRGRFLVARAQWLRARHDGARGRAINAATDLAGTAERLTAAIQRTTSGEDAAYAELAVALSVVNCLAERASTEPGLTQMARRWLEHAKGRAAALDRTGAPLFARARDDLDLGEGLILLTSNPPRAVAAAERLLARDPTSLTAWMLRIAAARAHDDPIEDLVVQAWRATGANELATSARSLLHRRGELAPFAELGQPTGRVLAFECVAVLTHETPSNPPTPEALAALADRAEPARLSLPQAEQELVDATLLALAAGVEDATCLMTQRLAATASAESVTRLLSVTVAGGDDASLARTARALAPDPEVAPVFVAAMRALRVLDAEQAEQLLPTLAPRLSEAAERELRAAFDRPQSFDEDFFYEAFDDLHDRLHPEVCLDQLLGRGSPAPFADGEDDFDDDLGDDFDDDFDDGFGDDFGDGFADDFGDGFPVRPHPSSTATPLMRQKSQAERNRKKRERRARGAS